jgi:hypothetical protein
VARPVDAACDIGAYEGVLPDEPPPPPPPQVSLFLALVLR